MLAIETVSKVLNLTNHPLISHVSIGEGYVFPPTIVAIFSECDADQAEVISLARDIFPECEFNHEPIPQDGGVTWNRFNFVKDGEYQVTVNHYEKEKAPANAEELKETIQTDYTSDMEVAQ